MATSGSEGNPGMRRAGGFRRAGDSARAPLRQAASRYGFAETEVLVRWPEAVGEALSSLCRPVRVSYGRARGLGATLTVEAEGARAPEVEMQAPRILERVNAFYGYRAVARLKIAQTACGPAPPDGLAEERAAFDGAGAHEAAQTDAAARACELARGAGNPALRAALVRLGTYVLAQPGASGADRPAASAPAGRNRGDADA